VNTQITDPSFQAGKEYDFIQLVRSYPFCV
jgi:hypothetical protein